MVQKLISLVSIGLAGALVAPPTQRSRRVAPTARRAITIPDGRIPDVFEGYTLPHEGFILGRGTLISTGLGNLNLGVASNFIKTNLIDKPKDHMTGQKKKGSGPLGYDEHLQEYCKWWADSAAGMGEDVPNGYKIFGGDDFAAHLVAFVESGPFYAAGLTVSGKGFEIKTFDEAGGEPSNHFMQVISKMKDSGRNGRPEVNVKFSVKRGGGLEIESVRVREDGSSETFTADPKDWSHYSTALLYDMFYFAEAEHATIHVLHYLLTNALQASTHCHSVPELEAWAKEYIEEVPIKYAEVGALLIKNTPEGTAAITGADGIGGSPSVIPILEARLDAWGQSTTADEFLANGWLSAPRKALEKAGVLTEFFKHVDLAVEFSKELRAATDAEKLAGVEEDLANFCSECGKWTSHVTTLETWVQLMATSGIIHGGTLSFGRSGARGEVLRWRSDSDEWDANDELLLSLIIGTTCGMQEEKHVMGSQKAKLIGIFDKDKPITEGAVQEVFDKYDAAQHALKEKYLEEATKRPDFNDVGFILSDFFPTGYDGKQHTMATYI